MRMGDVVTFAGCKGVLLGLAHVPICLSVSPLRQPRGNAQQEAGSTNSARSSGASVGWAEIVANAQSRGVRGFQEERGSEGGGQWRPLTPDGGDGGLPAKAMGLGLGGRVLQVTRGEAGGAAGGEGAREL